MGYRSKMRPSRWDKMVALVWVLASEASKIAVYLVETDKVPIGKWTLDAPIDQKLTWKPLGFHLPT